MGALAALLQAYGREIHYAGGMEEIEDSVHSLEEALSLWQKLGIQWSIEGGTARSYFDLGTPLTLLGDYERAIACEQEAVRLYSEVGDWHGVAWAYQKLGWASLGHEDLEVAKSSFCASLAIATAGSGTARVLAGMAELARLHGEMERAGRLYGAALRYEFPEVAAGNFPAVNAVPTYLEDPIFAAGWAEGQAMALPQAVAYALA